ncbi:hypothetical protein WDW37_00050 [Bdellovibrionota bacterium FG-1]
MDLARKLNQTAALVQDFFQGLHSGGWAGAELYEPPNLPVWMRGAARYGRFRCGSAQGDLQVTLIVPEKGLPFEHVANLYRVFTRMGSGPALILADDLPPKARGVLVRMGIPHVVSDGSIYAPQLGLAYGKIREPPAERVTAQTLSSVGLKLTAAYLLNPKLFEGPPALSELQERLEKQGPYSVSVATLSRAFQQLQELELVEVKGQGPNKRMHFLEGPQTWVQLLRVPVETIVRRVETRYLPHDDSMYVLSGDSALGKLSDLTDPTSPTVAMSVSSYRKWKENAGDTWGKRDQPVTDWGAPPCIIELWKEDPHFLQEKGCINAVELVLSLRWHHDERVQIALDQILEHHGLDPASLEAGRTSHD